MNLGPQTNLELACLWLLLAFLSGLVSGSNFHKDDWQGGYTSFKRRLYRLAHISYFGLGSVNFIFWSIATRVPFNPGAQTAASWGFAIGAITMPLCCYLMAHNKRLTGIFAVPVLSLITAASITFIQVISL
jgi:hypothetical protein